MKVRSLVERAVFCCAVGLSVAAVPAREVSDISMPEADNVAGRELRLNGMGVGKRFFAKVYVVGLYLEKPTQDARAAITIDEAKRIVLVMMRGVSRKDFVDAVKTGILRNSGPQMPNLSGRLDLLEKALPALKKGNVLDFTYLPGVGTLVRGQGREMPIPGKDFADALFSVWLGPKPISEALKRQLLSGPPSAPAAPPISQTAPCDAIPQQAAATGLLHGRVKLQRSRHRFAANASLRISPQPASAPSASSRGSLILSTSSI